MTIYKLRDRSGAPLHDAPLAIAMGAVPGVSGVAKFGTNGSVGSSAEYIWEAGNGWTKLPEATLLEVASTSPLDVMTTGTGAWMLHIEGLDANYQAIEDDVELNGQTPVSTTKEFLYVNRAFVGDSTGSRQVAGTAEKNQGEIYVADDSTTWSAGVPVTFAAIQGKIEALHGQTQQMIYTVPMGFTAFVVGGYIVTSANQDTEFRVMTYNRTTNVHRVAFEGTISNSEFIKNNNPFIAVAETVTVYVEALNPTSASAVSAGLDMILVDNNFLTE